METSGCTGYRMLREAQDLHIDWKWGQREREENLRSLVGQVED